MNFGKLAGFALVSVVISSILTCKPEGPPAVQPNTKAKPAAAFIPRKYDALEVVADTILLCPSAELPGDSPYVATKVSENRVSHAAEHVAVATPEVEFSLFKSLAEAGYSNEAAFHADNLRCFFPKWLAERTGLSAQIDEFEKGLAAGLSVSEEKLAADGRLAGKIPALTQGGDPAGVVGACNAAIAFGQSFSALSFHAQVEKAKALAALGKPREALAAAFAIPAFDIEHGRFDADARSPLDIACDRLIGAIDAYYQAGNPVLVADLGGLVRENFATEQDLLDPWGSRFVPDPCGCCSCGNYPHCRKFLSLGPDRVRGTADDVISSKGVIVIPKLKRFQGCIGADLGRVNEKSGSLAVPEDEPLDVQEESDLVLDGEVFARDHGRCESKLVAVISAAAGRDTSISAKA
jgi:hypothetical protein